MATRPSGLLLSGASNSPIHYGDAGVDDEAEQDADVGHERQHGVQRQVDRLPGGGEELVDDVADGGAELDEEAAWCLRGRLRLGWGREGTGGGSAFLGLLLGDRPVPGCPGGAAGSGHRRGTGRRPGAHGLAFEQRHVAGADGGDEDVLGDELGQRAAGLAREHVHGRDPLARVDPDPGGTAAVDDGGERLGVFDLGAEPVDRLAARQLGDPLGDRVDAATGHRDDLVLVRGGGQLQPAAPAAAAGADEDRPEVAPVRGGVRRGHFAPPAAAAAYSASNLSNSSVLFSRRMR